MKKTIHHQLTVFSYLAFFCGLLILSQTVFAQEQGTLKKKPISQPLVKHIYTADPSAHVFNGKIYIYPSHDIDAGIPENRELLRSISGKTQAPYLVDVEAGIKMPESLDIIAYFSKKFNVTMPMAETVMRNVIEVNGLKKYDSVTFLSDVQASQKPVIILISTTWCPPCKVFKPIFLQIAQEFAHVCEFICVDGDANMEIVSQLGIQAYPSIVCYKNGKKINFENYRSQEGLIRLINQLLAR